MKSYELIEHVADVRLQIKADSLEDLFAAALEGMNELITKEKTGDKIKSIEVKLRAGDVTALLIDFLSEVLAYTHINCAVYDSITFYELTETSLQAQLEGFCVDAFDEDIKAVTYHEAEVKKDTYGFYQTMVIFDI